MQKKKHEINKKKKKGILCSAYESVEQSCKEKDLEVERERETRKEKEEKRLREIREE